MNEDLKPVDFDGDGKTDAYVKQENGDIYVSLRWVLTFLAAQTVIVYSIFGT